MSSVFNQSLPSKTHQAHQAVVSVHTLSILAAVLLLALCALPATGDPPPSEASQGEHLEADPHVVEAWKDMRFGLFMCWGPVSLTGQEIGWSRGEPPWGIRPGVKGGRGATPADVYDNLYKEWKPDKFNAREWIDVVKDAGARYLIFLVKHHDGFCLYDTQLTDHRSTGPESAWKVDVLKEIADACHAAGIRLMIYYSQPDWHHPDYLGEHHERYIQYLHGQVRELLTDYGRIDGLWFDNLRGVHPDAARLWDAEKLFDMARSLQPHLIINNRCGLPGDYDTPENRIGFFQAERPWESNCTLTRQWAWRPDDEMRSFDECIRMLVSCATGDGNFTLNTGPMPDGRIEPRQAERFREIGRWLEQYGESIYETRGGPFVAPDHRRRSQEAYYGQFALPGGVWWGGSTRKDNLVYLHILRWPADTVSLPPIAPKVTGHSVLTGGEATVAQTDEGIQVGVPPEHRDRLDTIVKLELDGPADEIPVLIDRRPSGSLAFGKKATASNVYQNDAEFSPEKAIDDDDATRWGCDWGTHEAWLEVDLGEPHVLGRAFISEPYGRVRRFELQAKRGDKWQAFHDGTTIGECFEISFPPVTAGHIRLHLLETTEGPSIWEFQLFGPVNTSTDEGH